MCPANPHIILLINLIVHDGVPGTSMAREREGVRETPGGGILNDHFVHAKFIPTLILVLLKYFFLFGKYQ